MSLRIAVLAVAGLCFLGGLFNAVSGARQGWIMVLEFGIAIALIVFERGRYGPRVDRTRGTWEATSERFYDPESGQPVQVFYNAATGQRDYRSPEA